MTRTHQYMVTVTSVAEIDPDRLGEWVDANFDTEQEHIKMANISRGDGVSAPVEYDEGPAPETLWERAVLD